MKKVILIGSIAIVSLLSPKAQAQTVVSACGTTIKLTASDIAYLHRFKDPVINATLDSCVSIKYNSTADIIIKALKLRKPRTELLYIAADNRKRN